LILSAPEKGANVDHNSLNLIEDALSVFRNYEGRWALPGQKKEYIERDYALIDLDLMQESLRLYGFKVVSKDL
jgi:hypothetical protein